MSQEEAEKEPVAEATSTVAKAPSLFRNYISFVGFAIAAAGLVSIALMLLLEFMGGEVASHNPYIGIFTYILFPSVMGFGMMVALLGIIWERRRRRKLAPED